MKSAICFADKFVSSTEKSFESFIKTVMGSEVPKTTSRKVIWKKDINMYHRVEMYCKKHLNCFSKVQYYVFAFSRFSYKTTFQTSLFVDDTSALKSDKPDHVTIPTILDQINDWLSSNWFSNCQKCIQI